jgi:hypothetical protein
MALPDPHEDEESATPDDTPAVRPGPVERPDWLIGANEALESEFGRTANDLGQAPPDLRSATPPPARPPRVNPYEGFAQSAAGRSFGSQWAEEGYGGAPERPAPVHPAPGEGADPDAPREPANENMDARENDLAGPETPTAASEKARWSPPPAPPKSWWEPLIAQTMTPAGLIVLGIAAVVAIVAMVLMRPKDTSVALSKIRHNVAQYDGQTVTLHGKVGEVYPVGGGYSFYLLQGRDTIVVFTRSRTPVRDEHVSVSGVISTGVLNGAARQALLEDSH